MSKAFWVGLFSVLFGPQVEVVLMFGNAIQIYACHGPFEAIIFAVLSIGVAGMFSSRYEWKSGGEEVNDPEEDIEFTRAQVVIEGWLYGGRKIEPVDGDGRDDAV